MQRTRGAGVILGLLPLGLDIIGFGIVFGRGVDHDVLAGIFGLSFVTFGTLIGAGLMQSRIEATPRQVSSGG
ncbi:MAG: hypothetical protein ABJC24_09000 [Chloroflexota bacterium]